MSNAIVSALGSCLTAKPRCQGIEDYFFWGGGGKEEGERGGGSEVKLDVMVSRG